MLCGIIKRYRAILMPSSFGDVACEQQGNAHDAMTEHEGAAAVCFSASARNCAASPRTELPLNAAKLPAQKPHSTKNKTTGSSMGSPSASALSIDVRASSSAALVGRRKALCVHESVGESGVELYLFPTQGGGTRQGGDLGERAAQLSLGLDQRRARQRPLSRLAP